MVTRSWAIGIAATGVAIGAASIAVGAGPIGGGGAEPDPAPDPRPPGTVLLSGPGSATFARRPQFRFRSIPAGQGFECRIDRRLWRACTSPYRPRPLTKGRNRFRVRAVGPEGAADPTPAKRRFAVVRRRERIGRSALGRPLRIQRSGNPAARRTVLVVGSIHGDETAGHGIVDRLPASAARMQRVDLWVAPTVNPDGVRARRRTNARGVDLNRNFPVGWRPAPPGPEYPGRQPFSEPESRAIGRLIKRIRPRLTIWYHQPWGQVLAPCSGRARLERRYARISGLPLERCRGERLSGTATRWQEARVTGTAFVVELGPGSLRGAAERRHARAALAVAKPRR